VAQEGNSNRGSKPVLPMSTIKSILSIPRLTPSAFSRILLKLQETHIIPINSMAAERRQGVASDTNPIRRMETLTVHPEAETDSSSNPHPSKRRPSPNSLINRIFNKISKRLQPGKRPPKVKPEVRIINSKPISIPQPTIITTIQEGIHINP